MNKQDLDQEIAYWSYQKKASIMEGDLAGALESDKHIKQLVEKENV
jgi:hypothetical protein